MRPLHEQEVLRADCVTVLFPEGAALIQVSLRVLRGEALAIVGPRGAGKTTLLRACHGAVRPTEGHVHVAGRDLAVLSPRALRAARARIGFVPQELGLAPHLSAGQNVLSGALGHAGLLRSLRLRTWPARADVERARALLVQLGLGDELERRVDTLSTGDRQRVAIARALFQEPDALLVDEPPSALDPACFERTLELLLVLARERGIALVLGLQDLALARRRLPRLIGLRKGRTTFDRLAHEVGARERDELFELEHGSEAAGRP